MKAPWIGSPDATNTISGTLTHDLRVVNQKLKLIMIFLFIFTVFFFSFFRYFNGSTTCGKSAVELKFI